MRKYLFPPEEKSGLWKDAYIFLDKDKYIRPLIQRYGPCKIKPARAKDYFSDLVDAIASQQLSGKAAATIFGRIKEGLGGEITPEGILKTEDAKIRSWGMSWAKIKYLKDLSTKVKKGEVKIHRLNKLPDEEITKELVAVKGIGEWTADMFLMFTLARPDVFPVDDLGIRNGMKKLLSGKARSRSAGKKYSKDIDIASFSERWKPFRTVASWYVWKIVDND